ncbi:hypothetical protein IVA95_34240 [Bradyrhizobium sp. 157]|uniref:Tc toxin subunit A-related protein n=1 Tax=Bradyrhizobium sp. 157 TaxID=2782631 RepID=UPI001FF96A85|nr:neuraminidase-like domain-containing protein [Bradyrhizobium sp. 157]MCK1642484.1 hypothetical protein [Bradyrhizobium sp. 157]
MNKITPSLKQGARGTAVADLQDALRHCIAEGIVRIGSADRRALEQGLQRERHGSAYGDVTHRLVRLFQEQHRLKATGDVNRPTAQALNKLLPDKNFPPPPPPGQPRKPPPYVVKGVVRHEDGSPAPEIQVVAFDRDLRSEQRLGETLSDATGAYEIGYSSDQFSTRERGGADLVVRAFHNNSLLLTSPTLFNASPQAELDLIVPADKSPSLIERISRAIRPLLHGLAVDSLQEDSRQQDVSFLSGETGFAKDVLARFVLAHQLARESIGSEFWFALLGGPWFQFAEDRSLQDQMAALRRSLPLVDASVARKALTRSFDQHEIPTALRDSIENWIAAFLRLAAQLAMGDSSEPSFLGQAIEHAGIEDEEKQRAVAMLFMQNKGFTRQVADSLEKQGAFTPQEVADLSASFQLAELTNGDFSVVSAIRKEFQILRPEEIRRLAKKSASQWTSLIERKHAAGEIKIPLSFSEDRGPARASAGRLYAVQLERQFVKAFPTAAFAGGLERALANGGTHGLQHASMLHGFLEEHENFELLNTHIDEFLDKQARSAYRHSAANEGFRRELKAIQRMFKLAPRFEATDTLLADGVHSSQTVYRMGESAFVRRYAGRSGFDIDSARAAWNCAADTHAAVLTVVADLKAYEAEGLPRALLNGNAALSQFPNWANLFQTGDLCECEHCRSVLSPAAYFADLLIFLRDRKAKDILFNRRPDLGFIELNCVNALTPLPYVDVVCEVLENVVAAGANDIPLPGFTVMPADTAAAKAAVLAALTPHGITLGADFVISQVNPADPDRWVVHGDDISYLLKKKLGPAFVAEILRNTKADAAELRAYPAYVNSAAYVELRQARFPFGLPFDLFATEVRAALQKGNLQRWELMRVFLGPGAPNNPTDIDIAAEYFGISSDPSAAFDERRMILHAAATVNGQKTAWGEPNNNNWLATISNVKTFLGKTALEYDDLLALLDLKFINPTGAITIRHLDASCDLDQKRLEGLNEASLDRIHRFLRLWRKLANWRMWELDLVVRHAGIGGGMLNEPFLIQLLAFSRLKTRLGSKASVEQLCALFGKLTVDSHFTKPHGRRADGLYSNLFLNKKLIKPLDHAFDVATVDVAGPTVEKIPGHQPVILAALGIRQADLDVLTGLTRATDNLPYLTDDLTLSNLSFLWRHAWLAKQLKYKAADWKVLLKLFNQDLIQFSNAEEAFAFVEKVDRLRASGFTIDQANWVLTGDRAAKAAPKEAQAALALTALRKELQAIRDEFDAARYPFLNPPSDVGNLIALLTTLLQRLHRDEPSTKFFIATLQDEAVIELKVAGLPAGFAFPAPIKSAIRISYDEPSTTLRFTGLMREPERTILLNDPALAAVTGIAAYQNAIQEFFTRPRLALKFFDLAFAAPLTTLPAAVDFKTLSDAALAQKISYDAEERLLRLAGILSAEDKAALDTLSADAAYRNAVNSLFTQPTLGPFPSERIWLQDADLQFPLRDLVNPANDHLAANLATAVKEALTYLSKTLSASAVVQHVSASTGLTEAIARRLVTQYAILPATLMTHLTVTFAPTIGVVDYATLPTTFNGWFWAGRVALLLKTWKLTLPEWEKLSALTASAKLIDPMTLPLTTASAVASVEQMSRQSQLLHFRDGMPETDVKFLDVLTSLNGGAYTVASFAADVHGMNEAWSAADAEELVTALSPSYPSDYLLAETWERLRRAFAFIDSLSAGTSIVKTFAAPAMTAVHARTVKELLRSKLGDDTWLTWIGEIQDVLREAKRTALAAYLLTRPKPADAPTGKWENTNDLYAYYLLDVEMCACQFTSRLVQASGSVQLFVQRCLLGLEPAVTVEADGPTGDSAWRWWTWMRKYRVWEANRKVFLWPENWIEPELKKDRSSFFKELENELLQNEINKDTVQSAFAGYLEKLDGVAQLEIAGFFQEDDGNTAILHLFGRTKGADPHLYYYRRYDYRQWTPWEKIDLDIQGNYLIPAVVNKQLFLFWPVFSEVPDERANNRVTTPSPNQSVDLQETTKKLRLQMAVSDYRQGKWTPRRISTDADESSIYHIEIVSKHYRFFPIDRTATEGRFLIVYDGFSVGTAPTDGPPTPVAQLSKAFEVSGCKGVPELVNFSGQYEHAMRPEQAATGPYTDFLKWVELPQRQDNPQNDLSVAILQPNAALFELLKNTPWLFHISPPWHPSYLDRLVLAGLSILPTFDRVSRTPVGSWLPWFYNDKKRTYFVLPTLVKDQAPGGADTGGSLLYYPDIKRNFRQWEMYFEGEIRNLVQTIDFNALSAADRDAWQQFLYQRMGGETPPPYTSVQLAELTVQYYMRFVQYYLGWVASALFPQRRFHFKNFYHPFVCDFARIVYNPVQGIPALMQRQTQLKGLKDGVFDFRQIYGPSPWLLKEHFDPREIVDFAPDGAYSGYNWELFFHAPLLIANALSRNQRFEEARDWYHFIFNPIGVESPIPGGSPMSKYWITKPFFEATELDYLRQRIENIMRMLAGDTSAPGFSYNLQAELEGQVLDWRNNPFEPHRIANYRTVAYQKTVVMKYLDNLIAWGDYLFRQDSMESINEATQLYVLAAEILGPRPRRVAPQVKPPEQTFNELETDLDSFSNALVEVENLIPQQQGNGQGSNNSPPLPMLYFCIPHNDKMLAYWDTVADRLYKIRHCMNIEGVVRQLALFEPPIEPGALVKAVAGGIDIGSALADLNAPLPLYRFNVLLQRANDTCNDVKMLGAALLAALEKKDAEALSLLRQSHEVRLLEAVKAVREQQIDEAKETLTGIKRTRAMTVVKKTYYESREFMNPGEIAATVLNALSLVSHTAGTIADTLAGVMFLIPDFKVGASGFGGSPHATIDPPSGSKIGKSVERGANGLYNLATISDKSAAIAAVLASYQRRKEEWDFQKELAVKELDQIDSQIDAAELRVRLAEKELENHILQIENAKAADEFMRSKYTNEELYQWQVGQISSVFFQSYRLAYDLAKRAERCFRFELGMQDSSFISFGYWDSLKKGLMSGEKLQYDLRRLDAAYIQQNRRELELTKHVSLALLDPLAMVKLRETGRCFFRLSEEIFDLDFPGHYFRRIKSVSLTIPCVTGPYTTISCTLRLLKNSIRINTTSGDDGYVHNVDDEGNLIEDVRFIENNIPVQSIAASSGQNDSGLFELNFRDERYLPFEGAGTLSEWSLELFSDQPANNPDPMNPDFGRPLRQFDYGTITDAIMHIKYTAREDGGTFKNGAIQHLRSHFEQDGATPSLRAFSLRHEFPSQWSRFLHPADPADGNVFDVTMTADLFRNLDLGKTLKVNTIWLLARCTDAGNYKVVLTPPLPEPPPAAANELSLVRSNQFGGLHFAQRDSSPDGVIIESSNPVTWQLAMTRPGGGDLQEDPVTKAMEVEDMVLVVGYEWE